jgi:hypothetical protein
VRQGKYAHLGYREEFFGAASLAVPLPQRELTEQLGWSDVGIMHDHMPWFQEDGYVPADVGRYHNGVTGVRILIAQRGNRATRSEWHLHPDFVTALALMREGDQWMAIDEGYEVTARLHRSPEGSPILVEVRAEFLKDYLSARGLALYVNTFRSRIEVCADAGHISWNGGALEESTGLERWRGRVDAIHEGGTPFGAETAVFHLARTDIDPDDDVPELGTPNDENVQSSSWVTRDPRPRVYRISGELWRSEWVEPALNSVRVRGDRVPSQISFIVDSAGRRELADALTGEGRWLWFKPSVMSALATHRGGGLDWHTRDTGSVRCSPDYRVHFGVNRLGLVTVYAKDIANLPEWQQRIWAGYNVSPDGGVAEELLASQVRAEPADTLAPEAHLEDALDEVNKQSVRILGFAVFRRHDQRSDIVSRAHRFRATDQQGLAALAKDVARLTAESIDAAALQRVVAPPKGVKWGSLKSLENVLAARVGADRARKALSPLVGANELRHTDAHLSTNVEEACRLLAIDQRRPFVEQGRQLLHACVSALYAISLSLGGTPSADGEGQDASDSTAS